MSERKNLARDIFEQAIELESDEERVAFLTRACGEDQALRAEVQLLLEAHHKAAGFMEPLDEANRSPGRMNQPDDATRDAPAIERTGAILGGRYKLLENIGEGGMGSVWVAEQQQPVKRRVAIKLVKAGMDSKQVLARFESERQALAVMDHPNIAKVFDGGMTDRGRPYFVMEYVKGVPFTDYCNRARLPLRERLSLFIPVCQAVQHAHHKGIVHRDLKPSNILVCLYDGKPIPKVIDFGLAKAMHQSLTDKSIYTGHGIMVGTPLYMSPEQAEHNNLDVDTRTDIYSLGVILYELLTGSTPLERQQLQKAAIDEVLRLIKEVEPQRPSIRLSGSESLPSIAAQRSIDPRELRRTLAGDLDWIVMKSLEKERSRRYETPNGLARDIERFLNDEAVEACPPSRSYRLKKYIRKHRVQVTAGSAVLLALLIGIVGITWGLFRAVNAEEAATKSEQKTLTALVDVTKERDAKDQARLAEVKQREAAERNLLAGILRPIGFNIDRLDQSELKSLADWSALGDSRLQLLALETAFDDPETALRIARRAERVIQACVGLSPTRRAAAIELVSAKQRDPSADPRIRIAACWLALELGSTDLPAFAESITWLSNPNSDGSKPREEFDEFVAFAISPLKSLSAVQVTSVGESLIGVLENSKNDDACRAPSWRLAALAPRLTPEQLIRGWDALIGMLEKSTDEDVSNGVLYAVRVGLVALGPLLISEHATRGWDSLVDLLQKKSSYYDLRRVAGDGFVALAPRLTPEQLTRDWDALIGMLEKSTYEDASNGVLHAVRVGLVALGPMLTPEQVTRGGDALIGVLEKSKDRNVLDAASDGLVALAPRLTKEQVNRVWAVAMDELESLSNIGPFLAREGLAALAPMLTTEQVNHGWDALIGVLEKSTDDDLLTAARKGVVALVPRLTPEQLTRGWDALIGVLEKSTDGAVLPAAGDGLVVLASTLTPEKVTHAGDALIRVLEKSTAYSRLYPAGESLAALAPKLTSEQVTHVGDALIGLLEKSTDDDPLQAAAKGLAALAPRLTPEQVTRGWDTLIGVLEKSTNYYVARSAGNCLGALAPELTPEQVTGGWASLIGVVEKSTDVNWILEAAGHVLVALAPRLNLEQRMRTAEILVMALDRPYGGENAVHIADFVTFLDTANRERISTETITVMTDYAGSSIMYYRQYDNQESDPFGPVRYVVVCLSNPKSLAKLLSHPGCADEPREFMLQRFEELLFHDGEHVFLALPKPDSDTQSSDQPKPVPPPRRFHNLHDAAIWIKQNWPDFDLETNHPLTWRGGR